MDNIPKIMDIILELLDIIPSTVDIIPFFDEKILKKFDLIPSFWVLIPQHLRFLFLCY